MFYFIPQNLPRCSSPEMTSWSTHCRWLCSSPSWFSFVWVRGRSTIIASDPTEDRAADVRAYLAPRKPSSTWSPSRLRDRARGIPNRGWSDRSPLSGTMAAPMSICQCQTMKQWTNHMAPLMRCPGRALMRAVLTVYRFSIPHRQASSKRPNSLESCKCYSFIRTRTDKLLSSELITSVCSIKNVVWSLLLICK